jgi:hypothetical protein
MGLLGVPDVDGLLDGMPDVDELVMLMEDLYRDNRPPAPQYS